MKVHSVYFTLLLAVSGSQATIAAEINIDNRIAELAASTAFAKGIETKNAMCRVLKGNCQQLVIKNHRLQSKGSVKYSEVKAAPIPESITKETFLLRNCTSSERKESKSVTISYQEGLSTVTTDSISSTTGLNATFNIKGQALGINKTQTVSFSNSTTTSNTRTVTETVPFDEIIKPYTALLVMVEKRHSNAYLDFEGSVIPDADLYAAPCCGWGGETIFGGSLASQIGEKPITLRGQIWNAKALGTTKSYAERKLDPNNPEDCPPILTEPMAPVVSPNAITAAANTDEVNHTLESVRKLQNSYDNFVLVQLADETGGAKTVVPFVERSRSAPK